MLDQHRADSDEDPPERLVCMSVDHRRIYLYQYHLLTSRTTISCSSLSLTAKSRVHGSVGKDSFWFSQQRIRFTRYSYTTEISRHNLPEIWD